MLPKHHRDFKVPEGITWTNEEPDVLRVTPPTTERRLAARRRRELVEFAQEREKITLQNDAIRGARKRLRIDDNLERHESFVA